MGESCTFDYASGGSSYQLRMAVTQVIRGGDAWEQLKAANQFNAEPPEGKEYLLAKISAQVLTSSDSTAATLSPARFDVFSAGGVEYTGFWTAVVPAPKFDGRIFQGGGLEGYAAFLVDVGDEAPRLAFGADYKGAGGAWFSLSA